MKERDMDIIIAQIQIRHRETLIKYLEDNKREGNLLLSLIGGNNANSGIREESKDDSQIEIEQGGFYPGPAAASSS